MLRKTYELNILVASRRYCICSKVFSVFYYELLAYCKCKARTNC